LLQVRRKVDELFPWLSRRMQKRSKKNIYLLYLGHDGVGPLVVFGFNDEEGPVFLQTDGVGLELDDEVRGLSAAAVEGAR